MHLLIFDLFDFFAFTVLGRENGNKGLYAISSFGVLIMAWA